MRYLLPKALVGILALCGCVCAALPAFAGGGVLDGKTFSGVIVDKARAAYKGQPDEFVFKNGKFKSTLCSTFGYREGNYTAKAEGGLVKFEAETTTAAGGRKTWAGMVHGGDIEGNSTTVENGQESQAWFKGRIK